MVLKPSVGPADDG